MKVLLIVLVALCLAVQNGLGQTTLGTAPPATVNPTIAGTLPPCPPQVTLPNLNGTNSTNSTMSPPTLPPNCLPFTFPQSFTLPPISGASFTMSMNSFIKTIDPMVYGLLKNVYPTMNDANIAVLDKNRTALFGFLDSTSKADWEKNCFLGEMFYKFLEDYFLKTNDSGLVTFDRLTRAIKCKKDCDFKRLFDANFTANKSDFAQRVISRLDPAITATCQQTLGPFLSRPNINTSAPISPSALLSATSNGAVPLNVLFKPFELKNVQPNDTISLISQMGTNLDKDSAKIIGANVPKTANFSSVVAAACCVPPDVIKNANAKQIVDNLANMQLSNVDSNRKSLMATQVVKKGTANDVTTLMQNGGSDLAKKVPLAAIRSLNISMDSIPSDNWPASYTQQRARQQLGSSSGISAMNSSEILKVLPAVTASDISNIPSANRKDTLKNVMSAAANSSSALSTAQRSALLNAYLATLSSNPGTDFDALSPSEVEQLAELFVGASSTVFAWLSKTNNFFRVIAKNAQISSSRCCSFLKKARDTYAEAAIKVLVPTVSSISGNDLDRLGTCFAGNIPSAYLEALSADDFYSKISYFTAIHFQPNAAIGRIVGNKLYTYYTSNVTASNQPNFVVNLKGLAMYLNSTKSLSSSNLKTYGPTILSQITSDRETSDSSVQLCRVGTGDDSTVQSLMSDVKKAVGRAVLAAAKKKRQTLSGNALTCSALSDASYALNTLSVTEINSISNDEFKKCIQIFGASTNSFSTDQITALVTKVKSVYGSIAGISDTDIASINYLWTGFASTDLAQLNFTSFSPVETLGAIDSWATDQASALVGSVKRSLGNSIDSDKLSVMQNLACGLSSSDVQSINGTDMISNLGVLSGISAPKCSAISDLYTKAVNSYTSSVDTSALLAELNGLAGGISNIQSLSLANIAALSDNAVRVLPAAIVNQMSTSQLNALSSSQVSKMMNSPNSADYSSSVKSSLDSIASNVVATASSDSNKVQINLISLLLSTLMALMLVNLK